MLDKSLPVQESDQPVKQTIHMSSSKVLQEVLRAELAKAQNATIPSFAENVVINSKSLIEEQYGCKDCSPEAEDKCAASFTFCAADYYLHAAVNASHVTEFEQAGVCDDTIQQILFGPLPASASNKSLNPMCFEKILVPRTLSDITMKCLNKQHDHQQPEVELLRTPLVEFKLLDKALLSYINLNAESKSWDTTDSFYEKQELNDVLHNTFYNWHQKRKASNHPLESVFHPETYLSATGASNYQTAVSPVYKQARLVLHLLFLSGAKVYNANVHNPQYHFQTIGALKKKIAKVGEQYLAEGTPNDHGNIAPAFDLVGKWNVEDQWFYEMCTGLSMTATLACELKEIAEHHSQDAETRISRIHEILRTFREEIVSCPAAFWRIATLQTVIRQLNCDGSLLKASEVAQADFSQLWMKYAQQIQAYFQYSPQLPWTHPPLTYNHLVRAQTQEFLGLFVRTPDMEGGDTKKVDAVLQNPIIRAKELSEEVFTELQALFRHEKYPFSFADTACRHMDLFRSLWSGGTVPKDLARYFSEIHEILYPDGYILPDIEYH